jgi:hypothetical protein
MFLPFEPEDGAVDAHFDKGVLLLTIKKPAKAIKTTKDNQYQDGRCTQQGRLILRPLRSREEPSAGAWTTPTCRWTSTAGVASLALPC